VDTKLLEGKIVIIPYMEEWKPGFYIDDACSCAVRLVALMPDGVIVDIGPVSLVDFEAHYAILRQDRRRIEIDAFAQYQIVGR
jgi:hypothetical protein